MFLYVLIPAQPATLDAAGRVPIMKIDPKQEPEPIPKAGEIPRRAGLNLYGEPIRETAQGVTQIFGKFKRAKAGAGGDSFTGNRRKPPQPAHKAGGGMERAAPPAKRRSPQT